MSFRKLQTNLIEVLRSLVRNGEITERGLARITGVSQPHIHNVLKGVRELSPGLSDRILREFRLSVRDLLGDYPAETDTKVPVIQDPIGPGRPFPQECYCGTHPIAQGIRLGLTHAVVFRLLRDPEMEPDITERDLALVDRSHLVRSAPDAHSLYVVEFEGCGLIRYVRIEGHSLYLATTSTLLNPAKWERADLPVRDILEVIRGRIVWIGRQMEKPARPADEARPAIGPARRTG